MRFDVGLCTFAINDGANQPSANHRSKGSQMGQKNLFFNSADVALITKIDLAQAVEFDEESAKANIQAVRPGMPHFAVSAKTGAGLSEYLEFLALQLTESTQKTPV